MAGRLVTEEEIRGLVVAADGARPLGFVYFCDSEEEPTWRATAFVVRVRRGGFFAALPRDDRVQDGLQQLCEGEEDTVFFSESVIAGGDSSTPPCGVSGNISGRCALAVSAFLPEGRRRPGFGAGAYSHKSGWYNC